MFAFDFDRIGVWGSCPFTSTVVPNRYRFRKHPHRIPATISLVASLSEIFLLSLVPRFHEATHDHDGMNIVVILDMTRRRVGEDDLPRPIAEIQLSGLTAGWLSAL